MEKHKFKLLFLATMASLCSQSALAALSSYTHANGSTVVNINKADANGLSHNMYESFNVEQGGMILNNSPTDLIRESGNIAGNSNLDKSASLILNEVISKTPSTLNGYIEVAGQKADVIIANPNGITCSGCGFINTSRATLTTGTPIFTNGALTGLNVAKGAITVTNDGMGGADYTELLAKKININGEITTNQLSATAGHYTYDIASGKPKATRASLFDSSGIDVGALGGATAGIIQLHTTDAGAGVNNYGILNTSDLVITSKGALTNIGTIKSKMVNAETLGNITNIGTLSADQVNVHTLNSFINNGTIKATGAATINSDKKFYNGDKAQINATGDLTILASGGDIENKGKITTSKHLTMSTGRAMPTGQAMMFDDIDVFVAKTSLLNSGSIEAGNLDMRATRNIDLLSGGNVISQDEASISSSAKVSNAGSLTARNAIIFADVVSNQGMMQTTGVLSLTGNNHILNTGTLKAGTLALETDNKISNSSCSFWLFCDKGTLSADKITITAPKLAAISDLDGNYAAKVIELNKPVTPVTPETDVTPKTPEADVTPKTPETDVTPKTPEADVTPVTPEADVTPVTPEAAVTPETPEAAVTPETPEAAVTPPATDTSL